MYLPKCPVVKPASFKWRATVRSPSFLGLPSNFGHVPFVSHSWVVTLKPVSKLTLAGPHNGMSVEPEVKLVPGSLILCLVTGKGLIMYCGWSSSTTHRTFRRPVCAASLPWSLKEARAAVPPTPKRNVLLLILRIIDAPSPSLSWPVLSFFGQAARDAPKEAAQLRPQKPWTKRSSSYPAPLL